MNDITIIEGDDLEYLLAHLGIDSTSAADIYRLRIWQSEDGSIAKIKRDERTWSAPVGKRDES